MPKGKYFFLANANYISTNKYLPNQLLININALYIINTLKICYRISGLRAKLYLF